MGNLWATKHRNKHGNMDRHMIRKYAMSGNQRDALILSNTTFSQPGYKSRDYSSTDAAHLYQRLKNLNFKVDLKSNQTAKQMQTAAEEFAERIKGTKSKGNKEYDCVLVVVLTYGEFGVLEGTDRALKADDILNPFKGDKCSALAGRPKLFIFQACNPEFYNMNRLKGHDQADDDSMPTKKTYKIPAEADFHITWSLIPGILPLNKKPSEASIFIGALCQVLDVEYKRQKDGNKPTEYLSLMTQVLALADARMEAGASDQYQQSDYLLPCCINMMTKVLEFPLEVTV